MHIPELAPEVIFHIGNLPITNTIINTWLALIILLVLGILIKQKLAVKPKKLQNFFEYILELLLPIFDQVTGDHKKTMRFLPIVGTVFFFILLSNWLGLLPGTGSITFDHKMLLRPANTDLNLIVVMTLVSLIASHVFGLLTVGVFTYFNKFFQIKKFIFSFKKGPIGVFTAIIEVAVGLLEVISEMAKVLSLSFRLFGNIFAGEVLITVMSSLCAALIPTPFMFLELFVGLIQAGVFAILTMVYMTVATSEAH
jgi:F-type H+-transporting ATPase subunit a